LILWLLKKLSRKKWFEGPITGDPPGWDVPLDQTKALLHYEGDVTSV
jgi:hypothetical protein